jgi:DNA polymerase-3 subunit epsilon
MPSEPIDDLVAIAQRLERSGDYRVLRRLAPRNNFNPVLTDQTTRVGILLDVETTGLNTNAAEVIELEMVKFVYSADGQVAQVIDTFSCFNEPADSIPEEITAIYTDHE